MRATQDTQGMVQALQRFGLDEAQALRHDRAGEASRITAFALMCARHGLGEVAMFRCLRHSPRLAAEFDGLVQRIEASPGFIGFVHSGLPF